LHARSSMETKSCRSKLACNRKLHAFCQFSSNSIWAYGRYTVK
jgi:hypothetical protein